MKWTLFYTHYEMHDTRILHEQLILKYISNLEQNRLYQSLMSTVPAQSRYINEIVTHFKGIDEKSKDRY